MGLLLDFIEELVVDAHVLGLEEGAEGLLGDDEVV